MIVLSIREIKEGVQVPGRKMDELITALTRRGRGTRMPLHHPDLTAAGQPWSHNQAGRLRQFGAFQPLCSRALVNTKIKVPQRQISEQLSQLFAVSPHATCKSMKGNALNIVQFHPPTNLLCCIS